MAVGAVVEVNYVRRAHAQTVWPLLLSSSSLRSSSLSTASIAVYSTAVSAETVPLVILMLRQMSTIRMRMATGW